MDGAICVICTAPIDPTFSLLSPCCEKTWIHSSCLEKSQSYANTFFKCPACNVKGEPIECAEVLKKTELYSEESTGLHASVKVEVGCSTDECLCDEGRMRSRLGTQWEVIVCDVCSSAGTHRRCSDVQLITNQWQCLTCEHMKVKVEDSCDVQRENPNVDAGEIFSYLPLEICKTEITEDVGCSANPGMVKNETMISLNSPLPRFFEKGNDCFEIKGEQEASFPTKRKAKTRRESSECELYGCDGTYNRSHINLKPYKCYFGGCDAAYGRSSHLVRHSVTHTNVKPYKCDYDGCGAAFNQSSTLQTHRLRHSNERLYKCYHEGCYAAFNRISHLKRHQENGLSVHKKKLIKAE